jgi:hypothetical protein
MSIAGPWVHAPETPGEIRSSTVDAVTGTLRFTYDQPWNTQRIG